MQNGITKITIRTNVVSYNEHHQRGYFSRKGIIIVEFSDGKKHFIDRDAQTDITEASNDYIKLFDTKKTKEKIIFKEED